MDFVGNNLKTKMDHVPTSTSSGTFLSGDHHVVCARRNRPKLIPPPLVLPIDVTSLTEFAIIATSPRSPLMQKNLPIRKRALSCSSMEAVQSPIPTSGVLSPPAFSSINNNNEDTAASSPSPYPQQSFNQYGIADLQVTGSRNGNWARLPVPVWHCFLKGTKICFSGEGCRWRLAEDLGFEEAMKRTTEYDPHTTQYAPHGLKLVDRRLCKATDPLTRLSFSSNNDSGRSTADRKTKYDLIEVECSSDHPFYAKDKGWSSIHPQLTIERYGIFCHPLQINDICMPSFNPDIYESIRSFDFTPEDTSAVLALSNMAKHKQSANQMISGVGPSPPQSPNKKFSVDNGKAKRPMNGFMLFAKQHRVEYTQSYPGKDNRAISVLLGDSWKRMSVEERTTYAQKAKVLAEERKKIFPDCWKRRRSLSTS